MADTRPTPVGFWRAVKLCFVTVTNASRMADEDRVDEELRRSMGPRPNPSHPAVEVRRAFWSSLFLVLLSLGCGFVAGRAFAAVLGQADSRTLSALQLVGASLLLWGTLFVRGWSIQTYSGVTLAERVNQWIYRTLYFLGTAMIVCSLAWGI
jgi:hypothetical protein